ncbi:MAG: HigA family addiction module antidote protein [Bacteroidales bacterium]|nr:HigA family addiction module antidote protein [Bacteroidales bacterium]
MSKKAKIRITKELLSPPGDTIQETLDEIGMSQQELSERMGRHKKTINEIIKGIAPITAQTAIQLERVLGIDASFWLNREQQYREELERIEQEENLENAAEWVKRFPATIMKKRGLIADVNDIKQIANQVLRYFGIASPKEWDSIYTQTSVAFRISLAHVSEPEAISVWLRYGEIMLARMELPEFNKEAFKKALGNVLELACEHPDGFNETLVQLCKECGVGLVYTQSFSHAPINGAVRWFRNNPLMQLSDRYKTNDKFWFDFFHEAGHILLHGKRDVFLEHDIEMETNKTKEKEADNFAARILIPENVYRQLNNFGHFNEDIIRSIACKNRIHPGILVGRLQHDGLIKYNQFNFLKEKISLFSFKKP